MPIGQWHELTNWIWLTNSRPQVNRSRNPQLQNYPSLPSPTPLIPSLRYQPFMKRPYNIRRVYYFINSLAQRSKSNPIYASRDMKGLGKPYWICTSKIIFFDLIWRIVKAKVVWLMKCVIFGVLLPLMRRPVDDKITPRLR